MQFIVRGISQQVADEVRRTRLSPGYGHPAHAELARGTGPCRCCLRPFLPGHDRRLLFTFRPTDAGDNLMSPGPVFIHERHCDAYEGEGFPDELRTLPLAFEARATGSRVTGISADPAESAESQIESLFDSGRAEWLHLRHAEAGCFIARISRVPG